MAPESALGTLMDLSRRSAGELYGLEGVHGELPEIVVPRTTRKRADQVIAHVSDDHRALMVRRVRGVRVTGVEATLVRLAAVLDDEAFEIACEDARRRRLTSVPALRSYLERFGRAGRPGVDRTRRCLAELDPSHPSRSTLEVRTRRILASSGLRGYVRELPLRANGRVYWFDFAFVAQRTILETNGRRWHDDPSDYEYDNEKWSVPGLHGYRIVLATWYKVTREPDRLIADLIATMGAGAA